MGSTIKIELAISEDFTASHTLDKQQLSTLPRRNEQPIPFAAEGSSEHPPVPPEMNGAVVGLTHRLQSAEAQWSANLRVPPIDQKITLAPISGLELPIPRILPPLFPLEPPMPISTHIIGPSFDILRLQTIHPPRAELSTFTVNDSLRSEDTPTNVAVSSTEARLRVKEEPENLHLSEKQTLESIKYRCRAIDWANGIRRLPRPTVIDIGHSTTNTDDILDAGRTISSPHSNQDPSQTTPSPSTESNTRILDVEFVTKGHAEDKTVESGPSENNALQEAGVCMSDLEEKITALYSSIDTPEEKSEWELKKDSEVKLESPRESLSELLEREISALYQDGGLSTPDFSSPLNCPIDWVDEDLLEYSDTEPDGAKPEEDAETSDYTEISDYAAYPETSATAAVPRPFPSGSQQQFQDSQPQQLEPEDIIMTDIYDDINAEEDQSDREDSSPDRDLDSEDSDDNAESKISTQDTDSRWPNSPESEQSRSTSSPRLSPKPNSETTSPYASNTRSAFSGKYTRTKFTHSRTRTQQQGSESEDVPMYDASEDEDGSYHSGDDQPDEEGSCGSESRALSSEGEDDYYCLDPSNPEFDVNFKVSFRCKKKRRSKNEAMLSNKRREFKRRKIWLADSQASCEGYYCLLTFLIAGSVVAVAILVFERIL